ncbi:DUF1343 domain-containing protein [Nemorincola caseinilytica]|uniref:DUF1343 domain-containing protein n=1 Tax=Nemorincola caseinilytica TaxID=2054315 RepID=A0ABP8NIP9_9BACT
MLLVSAFFCGHARAIPDTTILPAAADPRGYMRHLKDKRVGLVINQTSEYRGVSLLDIMRAQGVNVVRIFVPEHGFRGSADAGAHIANDVDSATGIPVISLYGANKKPKPEYLKDIDALVYDLQDVGVRFYTYISTLEYCMEACADAGVYLLVLDRPNPNGHYVDGPVLQKEHRSFVGMQPIPIVYGMTAGEYALMLAGEKWVAGAGKLKFDVVPCKNYTHYKRYQLPVPPSPNLRTMEAVYAYPSMCLFEGTTISVGRGTYFPFLQYGCPEFEGLMHHSFTPRSGPGAKTPPYEGKKCYGEILGDIKELGLREEEDGQLQLKWLIKAYRSYPTKKNFFTSFFTKLAGTTILEEQIKQNVPEADIRASWKNDLEAFKKIRKKYLLYQDVY